MVGLDVILYSFACGAMFVLSVVGLESAIVTPSLDRWHKRFFIIFFAALVLGSAVFFVELAAYLNPDLGFLWRVADYLQGLLCSIPYPLLVIYLLRCCGEDWRCSALFRTIVSLWVTYLVMVVVSQFTSLFVYYVPDGRLHLGPAYPLLLAPLLAMLVFVALGVVRRRAALSRQNYQSLLTCLIPVTLALIAHMLTPVFVLIDVGLTISAFAMYRVIESDAVEWDLRQQREIAKQRASIAVLQMRPHFIYNTMTSIYYLCDQNPELAKRVTLDFTVYLRRNFNAISSEDLIPFSKELEHARAYLAVEQAQFQDDLVVNYEVAHTQFRMPPLTLQPIVENAVKHGMDLDAGPLHVWVRTSMTADGSEVVVENDGASFKPAKNDDTPHVALTNIEQRLSMMCDGRLSITPRHGGGTLVRITIPRRT